MLYPEFGRPSGPEKIIERIHDEFYLRLAQLKETPSKEWGEKIINRHIRDWGGEEWREEIFRATMPDEYLDEYVSKDKKK